MYPDSVSRVHFLFVLIYGKSGFFIKFVKEKYFEFVNYRILSNNGIDLLSCTGLF